MTGDISRTDGSVDEPRAAVVSHVVELRGEPTRLLVLLHGYGHHSTHLAAYGALLDPAGRWLVAAPTGPLPVGRRGPGWVRPGGRVPQQFDQAVREADAELDALCAARGMARAEAVIGGFSQGGYLALAVAALADRVRPAGVLAMFGTVPTGRPGIDLANLAGLPVLQQIGRRDEVVPREALSAGRDALVASGCDLTYREYDSGHAISLESLFEARDWLAGLA
jgi:phospholipase/carboxylesterase